MFLLPPEWARAAVLWWPTFAGMSVVGSDLDAASAELRGGPRLYPGDHLREITAAIGRAKNAAVAKMRAEQDANAGCCPHCGSSGWVIVPSPARCVAGFWEPSHYHHRTGEPVFETAAVACRCHRGMTTVESARARREKDRTVKVPMGLDDFERDHCPEWREQMARVVEEAEQRVGTARRADAALGDVRRMIEGIAGGSRV